MDQNSPASVSELAAILLASQNPDKEARRHAEQQLLIAEESSFEAYLVQLSRELHSETTPSIARQLAGIVLKNAISSGDGVIDREKRAKWQNVSTITSNGIKDLVLLTLESPTEEAQSAACQVIAKVARVDLPLNRWPQLLPYLMNLVTRTQCPVNHRKAAVTAIAYLCEDLSLLAEEMNAELLQLDQRNNIISTVSHAMKDPEPDVILAGCKAFYHTLYFARENIKIQTERDYIFQLIGQCLKHFDLRIQHASWECVLQLAAEYYDYLDAYAEDLGDHSIKTIEQAIKILNQEGNVTYDLKRHTEAVALAAIEFWNTLCDIECIVAEEEKAGSSLSQSKNYIQRAHAVLLPVLFEAMSQQSAEEGTESDEWTLAMAAATCVGLCTQVLKDAILPQAVEFVNNNFHHSNWKRREAAILAYGSIMEGPSSSSLELLIGRSFKSLCDALNDESVAVRDTTAWTIGRIASFHTVCIEPLLGTFEQSGLITLLMQKLHDQARVSSNICFAIHEISRHLHENQKMHILDPFFTSLTEILMVVTHRADALENNLRASAFETLSELIDDVEDPNSHPTLKALLKTLHEILERSFTCAQNPELNQLQGLICGCCNSIINKLGKASSEIENPQSIFQAFNTVIERAIIMNQSAASEQSSFNLPNANVPAFNASGTDPAGAACEEEDAVLAIGTLIRNYPTSLEPLLPQLVKTLIQGLEQPTNVRFCRACIGVVCEVAGSYTLKNPKYSNHMKPLINILYKLLHDTTAPISLKPPLITTVADLIVSMDTEFDPYLEPYLDLLEHAASTKITDGPTNEEWIDYFHELRDSVLEAYTCILHRSADPVRAQNLKAYIAGWLSLILSVVTDQTFSASNFSKSIEVVCDLVAAFRGEFATYLLSSQLYQIMIEKGEASTDEQIAKKTAFLKKVVLRTALF